MSGHAATRHPRRPSGSSITGLILAGGRGSRLGGIDKGLLELHGQPLVRLLAKRLTGQVDGLLLSANRHLDRYRALGFEPITDGAFAGAGPLAGMRAGLVTCPTPWLLAVPCDMPFVPSDLAARLYGAAPPDDARARVPFDGQHHHYACVLLPYGALGAVTAALDAGRHSLQDLLGEVGWLGVNFAASDAHAFRNLNTPADLAGFIDPAETP